LGAGRARKEDPVSPGAGVVWHARPGDEVVAGAPLLTLHADEPARFARALESLEGGYDIEAIAPAGTTTPRFTAAPLLIDRIA
ncbi:MAG: thymidine phosphorylase, partial [Nocardioides sp.]